MADPLRKLYGRVGAVVDMLNQVRMLNSLNILKVAHAGSIGQSGAQRSDVLAPSPAGTMVPVRSGGRTDPRTQYLASWGTEDRVRNHCPASICPLIDSPRPTA